MKILIVNGSIENHIRLKKVFANSNHSLKFATDQVSALQDLGSKEYELIILGGKGPIDTYWLSDCDRKTPLILLGHAYDYFDDFAQEDLTVLNTLEEITVDCVLDVITRKEGVFAKLQNL